MPRRSLAALAWGEVPLDLVDEGYVVRERQGRRNHYLVKAKQPSATPPSRTH